MDFSLRSRFFQGGIVFELAINHWQASWCVPRCGNFRNPGNDVESIHISQA
jgi:hypothetical protein